MVFVLKEAPSSSRDEFSTILDFLPVFRTKVYTSCHSCGTAVQWIQTYKTANSTAYSTANTQPTAWDLFTFILWMGKRLAVLLLSLSCYCFFLLWSWYPGVNKRWSSNKLFSFIGMQWKSQNPSLNNFNSKSNRLIITLRLSALSLNSCGHIYEDLE